MGWLSDILIGLAVGATIVGAAAVTISLVCKYIDAKEVQKQARQMAKQRCPDAIYAMIKSKDTRRVCCGIFGESGKELGEMKMEAEDGVDPYLYEGQKIPLYA